MSSPTTITELLRAWNGGDIHALDNLVPLVERELRRIAARQMRNERSNHTLQTTALVNEAYILLVKQNGVEWRSRSHFYAIAAQVMRRILLDHAKSRRTKKRGGGSFQLVVTDDTAAIRPDIEEIIELDEALRRLAEFDPIKSHVVEMRYFGGLSVEESAEVLGVAPVTVMRHWKLAKAWLQRELRGISEGETSTHSVSTFDGSRALENY